MFSWATELDQIQAGMFRKIIDNDGLIVKDGHQYAIFTKVPEPSIPAPGSFRDVDTFTDPKTQRLIVLDGMVDHAGYGSRGKIPVIRLFVTDMYGVVAKYRIKGNGNLRDGWKPDPSRTELEFVRDDEALKDRMAEIKKSTDIRDEARRKRKEEYQDRVISFKLNPGYTSGEKIEVIGEIKSIKEKVDAIAGGYVWKMLVVREDGLRVYGTVPAKIRENVEVGDTVSFVATLKSTNADDPSFAVASRPSKAKILEKAASDA